MNKIPSHRAILIALIAILMMSCTPTPIKRDSWGVTKKNESVDCYTLKNKNGMEVRISTYGGTIISLKTPDKNGRFADVVLGFDKLSDYEEKSPYFGSLIGRYGNRIGKGVFELNGKSYTLAQNHNGQHLHGGIFGFDKVVWAATRDRGSLKLTYTSKDGEEGYPGNLRVTATYSLTENNELKLLFDAITDQATVCNLTQHSYFNLSGAETILDHELQIYGEWMTPINADFVTTGDYLSVEGTPFDFRTPHRIGERVNASDSQLNIGKGYDHNWVIKKEHDGKLAPMATVYDPISGRVLEVLSTEPGIQFYGGNFLDGTLKGKGDKIYAFRGGFCLEPQHFPDSPNKPQFPTVTLNPGISYHHEIIYRFSLR